MLPLAPLVLNEALHALEKWLPARAGLLENALLAQDAEVLHRYLQQYCQLLRADDRILQALYWFHARLPQLMHCFLKTKYIDESR